MVFSVKNLTHLWREVRGVCECDSSSRRCLFSLSPILDASDCLLIQMVLAPSEPSNEGLFQVGIDLYIIGSNCPLCSAAPDARSHHPRVRRFQLENSGFAVP